MLSFDPNNRPKFDALIKLFPGKPIIKEEEEEKSLKVEEVSVKPQGPPNENLLPVRNFMGEVKLRKMILILLKIVFIILFN